MLTGAEHAASLARQSARFATMDILFVTATRIGDAVLSAGLLSYLVERHPGARLTIAAGPLAAPLFAAVPGLERLIALRKQRLSLHWLKLFAEVAKVGSREVGRAWVFVLALGTVVVWAISGPFFGFSDTWQLVINTGTTIITFLMVFLIQNSQNRDSAAIQVKLDELIRVSKANNAFMGLEHLTDEELEEIEGKNEGRAKAVLEARKASEDAKHKLRVIDGDG